MASAFKLDSIDIITNDSSTQAWGASVSGLGYTFHKRTVYSASGSHTWTKATGTTAVMVYVTGAGGGGGGGSNSTNTGGGGHAGGTAVKFITATTNDSTPTSFLNTTTVAVTVGAKGTGGGNNTAGTNGGSSSYGSFCSATGGSGGYNSDSAYSDNPDSGIGTGGDINLKGGNGGQPHANNTSDSGGGGVGGSSYWGGGGLAADDWMGTPSKPGQAPGSGGGGGCHTNRGGSDGADGYVVVDEYKGG